MLKEIEKGIWQVDKLYDVIIIGAGPGGISAAIYAKRAGLESIIIEAAYVSGGQIINTSEVDNYPGIPNVSGMELANRFKEHAIACGVSFVREKVSTIVIENEVKKISTKDNQYYSKSVIIATGATHRTLGIAGEDKLVGMGVSYCATCDGAFFKDKTVAVIGGGDVAVEDAIFLNRICKQVYLVHRRDELRAAQALQEKLFACANVEVLWNQVPDEIIGESRVKQLRIKDARAPIAQEIDVDGVFVAIGMTPNTEGFRELVDVDESGYIKACEDCRTNISGIYAVGDVRTKHLRQIVTAAADGANAITSIEADD